MLFSVITTISTPTDSVRKLSKIHLQKNLGPIIIVADQKGPKEYDLEKSILLSIEKQNQLYPRFSALLPKNHYARKNIGYLYAIANGASCIYETDDDNKPSKNWAKRGKILRNFRLVQPNSGWVNVYKYFSKENIWPRGLPLSCINHSIPETIKAISPVSAPIQQGLANNAPDVDAIWRLVLDKEFDFDPDKKDTIYLQENTWSPFNTQSTWWWPEAYPLLYIPSYCTFRMCDIWKSLVAQRCLWTIGSGIAFHPPEVNQDRNPHDLDKDFEDEIPGYTMNNRISQLLQNLELSDGQHNLTTNLFNCYKCLVDSEILTEKELPLLETWCKIIQDH